MVYVLSSSVSQRYSDSIGQGHYNEEEMLPLCLRSRRLCCVFITFLAFVKDDWSWIRRRCSIRQEVPLSQKLLRLSRRALFPILCSFVFLYIALSGSMLHGKARPQTLSPTTHQHNGSSVVAWIAQKLSPRTSQDGLSIATWLARQSNQYSNLGVFILVDLATQQPNTNESLDNCSDVMVN